MPMYHLAVDIGASSGRHILGWVANGKIRLQEIYRFPNGLVHKNGHLTWDLETLFSHVVKGLKRCHELGTIPTTMGIDTWGVDYVLLDKDDKILGDAISYRDARTEGVDQILYESVPEAELYARSGIQKLQFNTIYQLFAQKMDEPELLEKASHFLMIPDYLTFRLTGAKLNEYTNATTTQLVNAKTRDWDRDLMERLGIPQHIFGPICLPKTVAGHLLPSIKQEVGFDTEVVLPASHDTGSAVLSVPSTDDDGIYISSGTWSLMGIETFFPNCTEESRLSNFTNEGGYHYRYRYLKNIMGLWMLQNIRKELRHPYSFDDINTLARIGLYFPSTVMVNDPSFLAPQNMSEAIREYCRKSGQAVPETECELLACTYRSLAQCYANGARAIEKIAGKHYDRIYIIGGGSQDSLLNRLTAEATGRTVYAGPVEATAIGNLVVQMLKVGTFSDLFEARKTIHKSFEIEKIEDPCRIRKLESPQKAGA